ncbi:hypothetical protein DFH07DRAFT_747798 [Mycena maculata]|uniref:Zn(2)-C6 fungal-type domain-containing protein n=1 Tax=Mycena maculata TaxID=230809 RepID=A0AAD7IR35_9AGAR|nr:hypothetical protein DFH07DRAFT_747798 [Mycena maculata]
MPKGVSPSASRGRGSYVPQACDVCRMKKIKCDGVKSVCGPCVASGREAECAWTKGPVRKPRTEAHFEALRKRAHALEAYSKLLEDMLAKCVCRQSGNSNGHLQFRPQEMDEDVEDLDEGESDQGIAQELEKLKVCVRNRSCKFLPVFVQLEESDLLLHGITAPFRFASNPPGSSPFPEIVQNPTASYILMVDGVDGTHPNPDVDWSRYLPSQVPLDRHEHDRVLDLCFKFFTMWCMRVVPALFLRDMHRYLSTPGCGVPPKTPHYSPMLHNALIALATAFSDDPRISALESRKHFVAAAKSYIEDECQRPNISVVHALSLIGSFHSTQGEQMLGYLYFGMSARIGQALGLSIDSSAWVRSGLITHDEMLDLNWAYWTTFTYDVCWSLYVGRDMCVPEQPAIPTLLVDSEMDRVPWYHPQAGIAPQPNMLSRTFAASCDLLRIARRILMLVCLITEIECVPFLYFTSIGENTDNPSSVQLYSWKSSLTVDIDITPTTNRATATPHRLMMHCTYWWAFILLHRPFFHRKVRLMHGSDPEVDHVKLCKRAAENSMELLQTWRSLYTLRVAPVTLIQVVFSAGTIFLLLAAQATSGIRVAEGSLKSALAQVELCIQYLLEIGKSWQSATNTGEVLRNLLQGQLKAILQPRGFGHRSALPPSLSTSNSPGARKDADPPSVAGSSDPATLLPNVWPPSGDIVDIPADIMLAGLSANVPFVSPSAHLFAGSEMSGLLTMLGGETLPEAPFIAPFSMMDVTAPFDPFEYAGGIGSQDIHIPASELADLESFWQEYLR